VTRIKKFNAFTYLDVIYGMTVIMIVMGVLFGSIRVMEKRLRQNHLLTMADSFANQIINELELDALMKTALYSRNMG